MPSHHSFTYNERIWRGDLKTVAEARIKYSLDPVGQLVPFASVLYSFKSKRECANELLTLRLPLIKRAQNLMESRPLSQKDASESEIDSADVISTVLEWMSRCDDLFTRARYEAENMARSLSDWGKEFAWINRFTNGHTWLLLELTSARIKISRKRNSDALVNLEHIAQYATSIVKDRNQEARIYRKLGMEFRMIGQFFPGLYWGLRACVVPGIPLAARLKSLVAFLPSDN